MEADRDHHEVVEPYWEPRLRRDRGLRYYAGVARAGYCIPFVVTDRAGASSSSLEALDLEVDFSQGCVVRNTRLRACKLWLATRGMAKRQRLSVRAWVGHVKFYFAIARPDLSVLSSRYRFASQALGRRVVVWPNIGKELREVMGLIFMVEHNLLSERSSVVHLGESSMFGFSLMSTRRSRRSWR